MGSLDRLSAQWASDLGAWAVPADILARAPESPWGFPTGLFARAAQAAVADQVPTPSRRRGLEAVPAGGTVLDVGVGGGAASLPLAPPAGKIIAVDELANMLDAFAAAADERGIDHREVHGRWPDVAALVGVGATADVTVCHHVVYNVADLVPFLEALDRSARRRTVLELTADHPQADLTPLWSKLHGVERPDGPHASDVAAVAEGLGFDVHVERFERPSLWVGADRADRIAFARRRLCLTPDRDEEIGVALDEVAAASGTVPRQLVALWWPAASTV